MENKRPESILANKIIDLFTEHKAKEHEALGAIMVAMRYLVKDDERSSESLKMAVCKFIDSTVGFHNDD